MGYGFESDETVAEAFTRTVREELTDAGSALTRQVRSEPVKAVHSARKSVKKARSTLRLMRGSLDGRERRKMNGALREAAGRLSGARDAEVMIQTLDDIATRYAGQIPHQHFATVRDRLEQGRAASAGDAAAANKTAAELDAARRRIESWRLQATGWRALKPGLQLSYERGLAALAQAREDPTMEHLHDWRKRVKDLWYQLRLLAPVCGEAVRGHAKEAHALADLLGDDHDLAVLRESVRAMAAGLEADVDAVSRLIDHRRAELQDDAWTLGERVYAERPKAFVRRMRASWRAGRRRRHAAVVRDPAALAQVTRTPAVS